MKTFLPLGAYLLVGALLGAILLRTFEPPEEHSPDVDEHVGDREILRDLSLRLHRVEEIIASLPLSPGALHPDPSTDLERRLKALEMNLAAPPEESGGETAPVTAKTPPASHEEDLSGLSAPDAVVRLKVIARERRWSTAREQAELLLQRNLGTGERAQVLRELGIAHRALGDHVKSEAAFSEMLRTAGRDDEQGIEAYFQLAWTRFYLKDYPGGVAYLDEIVVHPRASPSRVGSTRLALSTFARYNEDPVRAREELEKILRDLGDSANPNNTWVVKEAKKRLAALDE